MGRGNPLCYANTGEDTHESSNPSHSCIHCPPVCPFARSFNTVVPAESQEVIRAGQRYWLTEDTHASPAGGKGQAQHQLVAPLTRSDIPPDCIPCRLYSSTVTPILRTPVLQRFPWNTGPFVSRVRLFYTTLRERMWILWAVRARLKNCRVGKTMPSAFPHPCSSRVTSPASSLVSNDIRLSSEPSERGHAKRRSPGRAHPRYRPRT